MRKPLHILAGDIGGTKTLLQIVKVSGEGHASVREERYESGAYETFDSMLAKFLAIEPIEIAAGCLAVAGPVTSRVARITNLRWLMGEKELSEKFSIPKLQLINDFHAVAHAVRLLGKDDVIELNAGVRDPDAPIAVLGAGTGLGEATVIPAADRRGRWRVIPSEGGHCDFAPRNALQIELLEALERRFGHVSYERLLSGQGLVNIFTFLRARAQRGDKIPAAQEEVSAAQVSEWATQGKPMAKQTFEIFVDIYGAEAGNLALKFLAKGGIYIAGGVAAKNAQHFTRERFMKAFTDKGRFLELLESYPVYLATNLKAGLMGAVDIAAEMLE